MFLFPSIDLREGQVVRLLKGDYAQQTTYDTDALAQSQLYESAGASWLHLVDLDGARAGRVVHVDDIRRICRGTKLKVEVGGGVRDAGMIDDLLALGVERVIVGTAALEDWPWFEAIAAQPAHAGRLVLGLDARQGRVATRGWEKQLDADVFEIARRVSGWPLAAIVYTDIATDGTLQGPNIESTRRVAEATKVPVVSSGGVGTLAHLRALRSLPLQGAIVGRAIYEGAFTVKEAVDAVEGVGEPRPSEPRPSSEPRP